MPPSHSHGRASKVLVLDDDRDTAETAALLLELLGHEVRVAFDGHRAIEIARVQRPDFVLLDLRMPRPDGHEVASRLRHELAGPVVIVAVTGCGLERERRRAMMAGCDHYFVKPIDLVALMNLVTEAKSLPSESTRPGALTGESGRGESHFAAAEAAC